MNAVFLTSDMVIYSLLVPDKLSKMISICGLAHTFYTDCLFNVTNVKDT